VKPPFPIYAAVTIASLSTAAMAQQADAYHACAAEKESAARLACFDQVDAARYPKPSTPGAAPAVSAAPAAAAPAAPSVSPSANPDIGLDARQARLARAQRGAPEPAPPAAIVATVVRVIERGPLISAFELSNGQIWEQSESMKFAADPQQQVTIRPGLLGAFFMKNTAGVSVRVHRLQ
jgi:hypothetical protein